MSLVVERFLKYISYDTQSDESSSSTPSTSKQRLFADVLVKELEQLGAKEIFYDCEHCYVYASVPETMIGAKTLGFIAHMDTSPAISGENVTPRIIKNYDGKDIVLNKDTFLKRNQFPELQSYIGQDLIVTDGTTLLGADDKAGISEIMSMVEYLLKHPEIPHGKIRVAFTPDEEIGCGADFFDVDLFHADFAYTVDGGAIGELEYENFNAAGAKVIAHGESVHPGDAKGKMLNAVLLMYEFYSMLPVQDNPMFTEGYEGFYHLDSISGNVESAEADFIIRDHNRINFEHKKDLFLKTGAFLNEKYGRNVIDIQMQDSYYNMKEVLLQHFHLIENAKKAMVSLGIKPIISPIRGGTDGARLSFMGLPCPNLCTGGHNFHGKYEFISIQSMEKITELLVEIVKIYSEI